MSPVACILQPMLKAYGDTVTRFPPTPQFPASNSEYTEITIRPIFFDLYGPAVGRECDFQVQAMIGHIDPITTGPIAGDGYYSYTGQFSEWSSTQTIYLMTTQPTLQPSPTVPEVSIMAILPLFVVLPLIGVIILRKNKHLKPYS